MAIRILSGENITGSFEVSGKVGIGTSPTSRNLSVFRDTAGSVANFLHYTDASNFAGLYIGVSQSSQTVSLNASGSIGGNFEMQCGNATVLSLNNSSATFAGNVVIGSVDSVVTGLNIGEASPTIQLFDTTNDGKLLMYMQDSSAVIGTYSNHTLNLFSNSTLALTIDTSQNSTFAGTVTCSGGAANNNDSANALIVSGTEHIRAIVDTSSTSGHRASYILESNGNEVGIETTGSSEMILQTGGSEKMRIDSSGSINIGSRRAALPSTFGYSSSYKVLILGSSGANYQTDAVTLSLGVDVTGNPSGSFNGNGREIIIRNEGSFISPNAANNGYNSILSWNSSGQPYFSQNVGIGTTSPGYKLDVAGNIRVDSTSVAQIFLDSAASNDAVLNFHENASQKGKIGYDTSLGGFGFVAGSGAFSTADMVLLDGGNVGIGTTSPDITGFGWNALTVVGGTTAGSAGVLELGAPSTDANDQNYGIIAFMGGTGRNAQIAANRDSATNDGRLSFWTSPGAGGIVERMRIDSLGNSIFYGTIKSFSTGAAHLILNGDTNNSGDTGEVDAIIDFRGDGNPGLYGYRINTENWSGQTALNFQEYLNGSYTSRLFISKDGNVGIGTTSPSAGSKLEVIGKGDQLGSTGFYVNSSFKDDANVGVFICHDDTVNTTGAIAGINQLSFITYGSSWEERMKITGSGNVGIGTSSPSVPLQVHGQQKWYTTNVDGNELRGFFNPGGAGDDAELSVYKADGATQGVVWRGTGNSYIRIDSTVLKFINFYYGTSNVGQIVTGGTNVLYQSNSDYRLKENVVEMTGALDRVSELKPSRYNFISHPEEQVDGFMAHELQEVVPQAVSGQKDEMNEDGTPKYQGVDHSQIVPLLVGAIKELKAEIELLKNK